MITFVGSKKQHSLTKIRTERIKIDCDPSSVSASSSNYERSDDIKNISNIVLQRVYETFQDMILLIFADEDLNRTIMLSVSSCKDDFKQIIAREKR